MSISSSPTLSPSSSALSFSPTFIPCTATASLCTVGSSAGAIGYCDTVTELCICPAGYSGEDDFDFYNDCHVGLSLRRALRIIGLLVSLVGLLVTLALTIKLFLQWGLLYVPAAELEEELLRGVDGAGGANSEKEVTVNGNGNTNTIKNNNNNNATTNNNNNNNGNSINERGRGSTAPAASQERLSVLGQPPAKSSLGTARSSVQNSIDGISLSEMEIGSFPQTKTSLLEGKTDGNEEEIVIMNEPPTTIREEDEAEHNDEHKAVEENDESSVKFRDDLPREEQSKSDDPNSSSVFVSSIRPSLAAGRKNLVIASNGVKKTIKKVPRPSVHAIKELSPLESNNVGVSPNSSYSATMMERRRKRFTILFVFMFLLFSFCIVVYECLLLGDITHAHNYASADFFLAANICSVCWGLWLLAYIWFGNMPSLAVFGKLFNLQSILITYPNLMQYLTAGHLIACTILLYALFFVFPLAFPASRHNLDTAALSLTVFFIVDFCIVFLLVCKVLMQQFTLLEQKFSPRATGVGIVHAPPESFLTQVWNLLRPPSEEGVPAPQPLTLNIKRFDGPDSQKRKGDAVSKAKKTVLYAILACLSGGPVALFLTCFIAFSPVGRPNIWLISQLIIIFGCAVTLMIVYMVVTRTAGGKKTEDPRDISTNIALNKRLSAKRPPPSVSGGGGGVVTAIGTAVTVDQALNLKV